MAADGGEVDPLQGGRVEGDHVLAPDSRKRGATGGAPRLLVGPNSEVDLREYNKNHEPAGSPKGGQFAPKEGGTAGTSYARPRVYTTHSLSEAVTRILAGQSVELQTTRQAYTLLKRLGKMALDAEAKGKDAPLYDLCNVSVKGTNLFCTEKLRTAEYPEGVPRLHMPQFKGFAKAGSEAEGFAQSTPDRETGRRRYDGAQAFLHHLETLGIPLETGKVRASKLRASQAQLVGAKVAAMMVSRRTSQLTKGRIFISRDNYIIDGHHRWAALVGKDARDGTLGDLRMDVYRIDAPISEVLHLAQRWTKRVGLQGQGFD